MEGRQPRVALSQGPSACLEGGGIGVERGLALGPNVG